MLLNFGGASELLGRPVKNAIPGPYLRSSQLECSGCKGLGKGDFKAPFGVLWEKQASVEEVAGIGKPRL